MGGPHGRYRHEIARDHEACPFYRHEIGRRARVAGLTVTKAVEPIGRRELSATKFLAASERDKVSACQKLAAQARRHPPSPRSTARETSAVSGPTAWARKRNAPQIFVTTHQPYFVDALSPAEVWILDKGKDGYSEVRRVSDLEVVRNLVEESA